MSVYVVNSVNVSHVILLAKKARLDNRAWKLQARTYIHFYTNQQSENSCDCIEISDFIIVLFYEISGNLYDLFINKGDLQNAPVTF